MFLVSGDTQYKEETEKQKKEKETRVTWRLGRFANGNEFAIVAVAVQRVVRAVHVGGAGTGGRTRPVVAVDGRAAGADARRRAGAATLHRVHLTSPSALPPVHAETKRFVCDSRNDSRNQLGNGQSM